MIHWHPAFTLYTLHLTRSGTLRRRTLFAKQGTTPLKNHLIEAPPQLRRFFYVPTLAFASFFLAKLAMAVCPKSSTFVL